MDEYKKSLEELPIAELVKIAKTCNLKVKGFSFRNGILNNVHMQQMLRGQILKEALNPKQFKKVSEFLSEKAKQGEAIKEQRNFSEANAFEEKEEQIDSNGLEEKYRKSEEKNKELQIYVKKIEKFFNEAKDEWKEERKTLAKCNSVLKQELTTKSNRLEKKEQELEEKKEQLQNKTQEICHLHALMLQKQTESKELLVEIKEEKKQIAIIGNPKNKKFEESASFLFEIFETHDIDGLIREDTLQTFDEIWLLTYKVPTMKQQLIHTYIKKPIYEVRTFVQLLELMKKGTSKL